MARDIDRKLRLTATFLGLVSRKDLAAAFRRVNAKTSFDVSRADKWLQGRSQPREQQIYEDWTKLLELDRPARWMADCEVSEFLDVLSERHGRDRAALERELESIARSVRQQGPALALTGSFVCYSHAWSPYFRGRIVRGELDVSGSAGSNRLRVAYSEVLPTGRLEFKGVMVVDKLCLRVEVGDESDASQFMNFCLFPPTPPASVLGGLFFGTAVIGPDAQPSVSRVVMVRSPVSPRRLRTAGAYLPLQGSLAQDLQSLGVHVENVAATDDCLTSFLNDGGGAFDQVPKAAYRTLVDLFDRAWLGNAASTAA